MRAGVNGRVRRTSGGPGDVAHLAPLPRAAWSSTPGFFSQLRRPRETQDQGEGSPSWLCAVRCCSVVSNSAIPWTAAHQAPLSMGFSRQEYWSGLPCPPPGDLPNPGIKPRSPAWHGNSLLTREALAGFSQISLRRK